MKKFANDYLTETGFILIVEFWDIIYYNNKSNAFACMKTKEQIIRA